MNWAQTEAKSGKGIRTSGIRPRPHCLAASAAMRLYRSFLASSFLGAATQYRLKKGTTCATPSSTPWRMTSSSLPCLG